MNSSEHSEQIPVVRRSFYTMVIKRLLDMMISGIVLLILSPLLIILSILELFFHGRPIFYSQERPGLHEKIFKIYKFRSMTNEVDQNGHLLPAAQRVTGFGRFVRRFSLDELPELLCVFTGKMSLIGPRPLLVKYLPLYSERHRMRHEVKPGLTLEPLKKTTSWTWNDQFENDIWYVEHCSFLVDVKMIFAIMKQVVHGSEYRVNDTREEFNGSNLYSDAKETGK